MLGETALMRPRLFPDAVALAIKGYHLFVLTAEILRADAFARKLADTWHSYQGRVSLALRPGRGHLAATLERSIRRVLGRAQRRQARFSQEMQQYLQERVQEFALACAAWTGKLRLARERSG